MMDLYKLQTPLRFTPPLFLALLMTLTFSTIPCAATTPLAVYPSFRVETDIYEGEATAPQSQHLILFDSGVVYDLPVGQGATITVFDVPRGRVVLIHKTSRVRTSIETDTLVQMTAQVRAAAAEAGAGQALGLDAKVVPLGDKVGTYELVFAGNRYQATAQTVTDPAIAADFASFTAWASRLNITRHIGSPPFARITLADFLAAEKSLPRQVKLEVRRGLKTRTFRSEHIIVERLSDLDRKKISDVGGMMATFQEVDFSEFPSD